MATLEVHDGRGRVERVEIAHDEPLTFGSSPKCDIVLSGEGVLPFHGRVRWQARSKKFKVDASPEAEYLRVNGHKMAASSFRLGDEVQVGGYRIFMVRDGGPDAPPARDDPTRVQAPTFVAPPAAGTVIPRGGWRETREVSPPDDFEQAQALADERALRRAGGAKPAADREPRRGWSRFLHGFSPRAYAPGREDVLSSPLVAGLGASLVALVLVGVSLYGIITRTAATRLYNQAVGSLDDGDYRNAIRRFDEFLRANPDDPRAGKARVHRAIANVRQYTTAAGASWSLALEAERAMVDAVGREPAYRDSSTELDELVLRTGEELADRARGSADPKTLAEAESALPLHERVAEKGAAALLKRSRLPEKLDAARAAVRKAGFRRERLAAMDAALQGGSSAGVYAARDALVAEYADQAADRDLLARMTKANALIRQAVTVDASGRPAETEPHPEPLGPPLSLVIRGGGSGPAEPPPAAEPGPPVFALADGFAFGLDGSTGAPLWQVPVGLASPFPPQPIPGGTTALAFDARHGELVRLDARTGALLWRQALGGRPADPPLVLGNQVLQTTPGGKVLVIDLASGALRAAVDLKTPLARAPVADESGQALYVAAEKDCLFVLARDPLGCAAVEYLGHDPGSIACPPARVGRYLVVAENHQINESRWRVFVLGEDGLSLAPAQQVPVLGWTWGTPAASGSVVWAAGDRGGVAAYAIGAYGAKDPFRRIAAVPPDARPSGPAFALARSEHELWVGSGRSGRYELNPEGGKIAASWTLASAGPALAPPQAAGPRLVLTQQNLDGPGVALWGVDPKTGAVAWRTVLGAAWPSPPSGPPGGPGAGLAALGADGRALAIPHEALARGGFVTSSLPRPGGFRLPPGAAERVEGEGWTAVAPEPGSSRLLVRAGDGGFREVNLPAPVGARPVAWGKDLLVPGGDGRAYLIDPATGESRAEPYVPPFDRARPTRWKTPVRIAGDAVALADDAGRVRRLVRVRDPRPRLVASAEAALGRGLAADPASTGGAVVLVTTDGRARALAARDLSPVGAWPLDAPPAVPPASAGGLAFLADTAGGVLAFGGDGQRLWSARLGKGGGPDRLAAAGPPAVRGDAVWFLTRDGTLHARSRADGSPLKTVPLGVLPAGGPVASGDDLVIPVGLGTLRLLSAEAAGPAASAR